MAESAIADRNTRLGSNRTLGYELREPFPGETKYFKENPKVTGMATEDGKITINPFADLSEEEKQSVIKNEATRLWIRDNKPDLNFDLTPEQKKFFEGTEYGKPENSEHAKATIVARIIAGDPSAGTPTQQQRAAVDQISTKVPKDGNQTSRLQQSPQPPAMAGKYGNREDGSPKGGGWLGEIKLPDGSVATEYTVQSQAVAVDGKQIDFPLLVPTLTAEEVELLRTDIIPNQKAIPDGIMQKSVDHARSRLESKNSVFVDSPLKIELESGYKAGKTETPQQSPTGFGAPKLQQAPAPDSQPPPNMADYKPHDVSTPRLDRWAQMQKNPFGTNTNMGPPTAAQSDYKRMASDYGQALRTLRRAGRRGDASASLAAVDVANQARDMGVQGVQGIRRSEDQRVAEQRYEATLGQITGDREATLNGAGGAVQAPRLDAGVQTPRLDAGVQTPRLDAMAPGTLGAGRTTAATGDLLQQRKGLFERMKTGVTPEMQSEAAGLGVTASGWQKGLSRLGAGATTAATGDLLQQRKSLFDRMKSGVTPEMEGEAAGLGVTASGWQKGLSRLGAMAPAPHEDAPAPPGASAAKSMFAGTPFDSGASVPTRTPMQGMGPQTPRLDGGSQAPSAGTGGTTPSKAVAPKGPFAPFSAKTHNMDMNEGGGRPGQVSLQDQNNFFLNIEKNYSGAGHSEFKDITRELQKQARNGGVGTRYAAQFQGDLIDVFKTYDILSKSPLGKDLPSPPNEKTLKSNPEALSEWISEVNQRKLDLHVEQKKSEGQL